MVVKRRQSISSQDDGPKKRRQEILSGNTLLPDKKAEMLVELPKKPRQPKQLFINNRLEQLRDKPDFNKKKAMAEIVLQWHGLSDKEKQKWVDQASEEENKYVEKLKLYKADNTDIKRSVIGVIESVTKKRTSKALRLTGLPKKPIPAKQMFIEDRLEQLEKEANFNKKKARAQASQQWDSLSEKERQMWTQQAADEGKKYIKLLKLFKTDNPEIQLPKTKTTKEGSKKGSAGKPEKPPKSGYALYFKTMLAKSENLRSLAPEEQIKEILSKWNKMPESEKEEYWTKLDNERKKYKLTFATYLKSLPQEERQKELRRLNNNKTASVKYFKRTQEVV